MNMSLKLPIYMDYNATTPVDPRVVEAMLPYFTEHFGNAASTDHEFGATALKAVNQARVQIGTLIGAKSEDIIFTSGATESDNIALIGVADKYAEKGDHIITCVTEHKAVLDTAKYLEQLGKKVTYLPVDQYGMVDPDDVRKAITPQTILISIMAGNNEIGTIPDLKAIGEIAREHGVIFHTDGAQYIGHLPLDVNELKIDLLSISAHKMYGPKGIGALYVRRDNPWVKIAPIIHGGGHERGIRSGTLNVPAIIGFGMAADLCRQEMPEEHTRLGGLLHHLYQGICEQVEGVELNGHPTQRLPHNLNISIKGIKSKAFIVSLKDVAISAGSACTTASVEPSHVIRALGFGDARAHSSLRLSIGRFNFLEEISYVSNKFPTVVQKLRKYA
jgi:cysteine desulfurase